MTIWTVLGVMGWIIIGVVIYGLNLAHAQLRWPRLAAHDRKRDIRFSIWMGMTGPLGIPAYLLVCYPYHKPMWWTTQAESDERTAQEMKRRGW